MTTPMRPFLRSIPHACWLAFVAVLWLAGDARLAVAQAGLPASCTNFTDSSLSAGTAVKAVHITQLRSCIADLRAARQLSGPTWTDPTITPGQTVVKAVHLTELRSALNAVYADAGLSAPAYGESISAGVTPIRAGHVMELRAAIVTIPSCSYMIEPGTLFVGAEATAGAVSVATFGGCEWTASGGGFAPLSSGSSFSGSGIATFAISANASSSGRNTTVVVAGQNVVVNQAGVGQSSQNDPAPPTMGEPVDTEVVYFHTDAIGSVRMITDAAGAVLHRYDYSPDGALLNEVNAGAAWNRRTWAGKERDVETTAGATQPLDYFGARYYAQQLGRFTSVDPVLVSEAALVDPQQWNRFVGLRGNPIRFTDPDGRCIGPLAVTCGLLAAGALRGGVVSTVAYLAVETVAHQAGLGDGPTVGGALGAFASGAASGGLSGSAELVHIGATAGKLLSTAAGAAVTFSANLAAGLATNTDGGATLTRTTVAREVAVAAVSTVVGTAAGTAVAGSASRIVVQDVASATAESTSRVGIDLQRKTADLNVPKPPKRPGLYVEGLE